jgi:hypothetical protein
MHPAAGLITVGALAAFLASLGRRKEASTLDEGPGEDSPARTPTLRLSRHDTLPVTWAHIPYESDPTNSKVRPVVIVGADSTGVVGLPLFSRPRDTRSQYYLPIDQESANTFDRHGRVTYIQVTRPIRLPWTAIALPTEKWGRLSEAVNRRLRGAVTEWQVTW